jgi:hypothetical protein
VYAFQTTGKVVIKNAAFETLEKVNRYTKFSLKRFVGCTAAVSALWEQQRQGRLNAMADHTTPHTHSKSAAIWNKHQH